MSASRIESLLAAQSNHEKRYNCAVCLEAKLEMVSGSCQHRLCCTCLYLDTGCLKPDMHKCPICCTSLAFPQTRPSIPEDIIEMQRLVGVRECPQKHRGCKFQMWDWELDDHISICQFRKPAVPAAVPQSTKLSQPELTHKTRSKRSCSKAQQSVGTRRSSRSRRS